MHTLVTKTRLRTNVNRSIICPENANVCFFVVSMFYNSKYYKNEIMQKNILTKEGCITQFPAVKRNKY